MVQILESDIEVVIGSGFIYLPLMLDPAIEKETRARAVKAAGLRYAYGGRAPDIIELRGKPFLRSVSIHSILENYDRLDPETYEHLRRGVLNKFLRTLNPNSLSIDERLRAIIFQVMPHFVRKENRLHRKSVIGEEILDLIDRRVNIPIRYHDEARRLSDTVALQDKLTGLASLTASRIPPFSGLVPARSLRQWFLKVLEARIIEEEKNRLGKLLRNHDRFARLQKKYTAVLLFVNERGALEISGCGFFRTGVPPEYYVYVHTGEYALRDFYGRTYLFPDCRVGVPTVGPPVPYVLDRYKHPFLKGFNAFQKICVRGDFVPADQFSATGAIQAIEEGIGALFHGYNYRRGNGYHRLEGMKIEENSIVFDELRVPSDDLRLVTGEIEVKNDVY
jgi:hypothetical protein